MPRKGTKRVSPALQVILDRWGKHRPIYGQADLRTKLLTLYGQTRVGRGKIVQSCLEPGRQRLYRLQHCFEDHVDSFSRPITDWRPYARDAHKLLTEYREFLALAEVDDEHLDAPYLELQTLLAAIRALHDKFKAQPLKQAHQARLLGILQAIVDRPPPRTLWERLDDAG